MKVAFIAVHLELTSTSHLIWSLNSYVSFFIDAALLSLLQQKPVQASKPVHLLGWHLRSSALIGAAGM
jgi:hypothetical protein